MFPEPFELGLRRLRDDFELDPVEYPTTRVMGADPRARAADVNAAFADPRIKAVLTSIGGEDQLKVLPYIDRDVVADNPKPFFGYSDNTNILHFLWGLGIVGYHGGSVMIQWGRSGAMHPLSAGSLRRALFTHGDYELAEPSAFTDEERNWAEPGALDGEPELEPAPAWSWHGPQTTVTGAAWGGSLEVVDFHLRTNVYMQPDDAYNGEVLFLETSEEMPDATYIARFLMCMGERGLLQRFPAVLVGRPKAWSLQKPLGKEAKAEYGALQRQAIVEGVREYNPEAVVVTGVDFGHTDPQLVIPHGGQTVVDPTERRIAVTY